MIENSCRIFGTGFCEGKNWIDIISRRTWFRNSNQTPGNMVEESNPLLSANKLRCPESIFDYGPSRGIPDEEAEKALLEARDENHRIERESIRLSVTFRGHYKGGIGLSFDVLA